MFEVAAPCGAAGIEVTFKIMSNRKSVGMLENPWLDSFSLPNAFS